MDRCPDWSPDSRPRMTLAPYSEPARPVAVKTSAYFRMKHANPA